MLFYSAVKRFSDFTHPKALVIFHGSNGFKLFCRDEQKHENVIILICFCFSPRIQGVKLVSIDCLPEHLKYAWHQACVVMTEAILGVSDELIVN